MSRLIGRLLDWQYIKPIIPLLQRYQYAKYVCDTWPTINGVLAYRLAAPLVGEKFATLNNAQTLFITRLRPAFCHNMKKWERLDTRWWCLCTDRHFLRLDSFQELDWKIDSFVLRCFALAFSQDAFISCLWNNSDRNLNIAGCLGGPHGWGGPPNWRPPMEHNFFQFLINATFGIFIRLSYFFQISYSSFS